MTLGHYCLGQKLLSSECSFLQCTYINKLPQVTEFYWLTHFSVDQYLTLVWLYLACQRIEYLADDNKILFKRKQSCKSWRQKKINNLNKIIAEVSFLFYTNLNCLSFEVISLYILKYCWKFWEESVISLFEKLFKLIQVKSRNGDKSDL